MNTSQAATTAGVTVDTIRHWCRYGAIAAVKQAGRWAIDATSLAYRISLGKLARKAKPVELSTDSLIAIGGSHWTKAGKNRVYINNWAEIAGYRAADYARDGRDALPSWQGRPIGKTEARRLLGSIDKVWFDTADNALHCRFGFDEARTADRDEIWQAVVDGIRTAIAAL